MSSGLGAALAPGGEASSLHMPQSGARHASQAPQRLLRPLFRLTRLRAAAARGASAHGAASGTATGSSSSCATPSNLSASASLAAS